MKILAVSIVLITLSFSTFASQKILLLTDANCTIVYSLEHSANTDFTNDIAQLQSQLNRQNIRFIDLNSWQKKPPYIEISGRIRNQIRSAYNVSKDSNQALIFNDKGQLITRRTGWVPLVTTLLDCQK